MIKEEIRTLMTQSDIGYKELAVALKIDYSRLYYTLNHNDSEIELNLYIKIMDYINKVRETTVSPTKMSEIALKINAKINRELGNLNQMLLERYTDEKLSSYEKAYLKISLQKMRDDFNTSLTELLSLTGGANNE